MPRNKLRSAKEDALNQVEAQILLNACRDLLDNLTVRLPLYAGLRIGEVQHLKKSWLDLEKGVITIPARQWCNCYECRSWRNRIWTPKTSAGQRSLIIVPELELYLRQLVDGINRSRQALEKRFERIRARSGLMKVAYPHCIRASFATRLAEAGISAPSLTYILGWATLTSAESYIQSSMKRAHSEMKELVGMTT
jgi:integrase